MGAGYNQAMDARGATLAAGLAIALAASAGSSGHARPAGDVTYLRPVPRDVPPYLPLRPAKRGRPTAFARCMGGQRRQGLHGPGAWEQARHGCAHARR